MSDVFELRTYGRPLDEDYCVPMWLRSWASSSYAEDCGAGKERTAARSAWWKKNSPYVAALLREEDTWLVCSPRDPDVLYAFACLGRDAGVIHYAAVHEKWHRQGFARDLFVLLLGDRLMSPHVVTHELCDMDRARIIRTSGWRLDVYYNARKGLHHAA